MRISVYKQPEVSPTKTSRSPPVKAPSPSALRSKHKIASAERPISLKPSTELIQSLVQTKPRRSPMPQSRFEQLYGEKLRKQSARSGSPLSRKEFLEQEELKECSFSPSINSASRSIASRKGRSQTESLYSDAVLWESRHQEAVRKAENDAKREARRAKINPKSVIKARRKLRKELQFLIEYIGTEEDNSISYDSVGKLLNLLGLYKILYDNEGEDSERTITEREMKELDFQTNLWKMLVSEDQENATPKVLVDLLVLLHDSNTVPSKTLAKGIELVLSGDNKKTIIKDEKDSLKEKLQRYVFKHRKLAEMTWTPLQLIAKFKALRDPVPLGSTHFMRFRELSKVITEDSTFTPDISPRSERLAQRQLNKFVESVSKPNKTMEMLLNREGHIVAGEKNFLWQATPVESNSPTTLPVSRFYTTQNNSARSSHKQLTPYKEEEIETRIKLLYYKHKKAMEKIESQRTEIKRQELNGCTFKPVTNNRNAVSGSKFLRTTIKREQKPTEQIMLEKCTFHPKINNKSTPVRRQSPMAVKMNKNLREQTLESIAEDQEIEVNMAPGVKQRFTLKKGANLERQVKEFLSKCRLSREEGTILKDMLRKKLTGNT